MTHEEIEDRKVRTHLAQRQARNELAAHQSQNREISQILFDLATALQDAPEKIVFPPADAVSAGRASFFFSDGAIASLEYLNQDKLRAHLDAYKKAKQRLGALENELKQLGENPTV